MFSDSASIVIPTKPPPLELEELEDELDELDELLELDELDEELLELDEALLELLELDEELLEEETPPSPAPQAVKTTAVSVAEASFNAWALPLDIKGDKAKEIRCFMVKPPHWISIGWVMKVPSILRYPNSYFYFLTL